MSTPALRGAAVVTAGCMCLGSGAGLAGDRAFRTLTLQERVAARRTVEQIDYSHQIGATRPFDQARPPEAIEREVRTDLALSAALETFWSTPVTAETLRKEVERMARSTRMPERLRELYHALSDDPLLVGEALARPVLVRRLTRSFFSHDRTLHEASRGEAEALRASLAEGRIDPFSDHPHRSVLNVARLDREDASHGNPGRGVGLVETGRGDAPRLDLSLEEFQAWRSRWPDRAGEIGPLFEDAETERPGSPGGAPGRPARRHLLHPQEVVGGLVERGRRRTRHRERRGRERGTCRS